MKKLISLVFALSCISSLSCSNFNLFSLNTAVCGSNLVTNSSFEDPSTVVDTAYLGQVPGWSVDEGGSIEINKTWAAPDGKQSVDLNPLSLGVISQNVTTKPGQAYILSFSLAGNPETKTSKKLEVLWGNNSLGVFEFVNDDTTTKTNMKFQTKTIEIPTNFTISDYTKLSFVSGTPGPSGAVIDNVVVKCK